MADNVSAAGPKSTFEAYRAEGDMLFKQQEFSKALESYNEAMELRNDDKNCLVARSRCYLQMGDTENALRDAEASMADEPNFFKGLLCKADALYFKGEFEMALVFYHRGNKLRPEQHEFRLGIQKCQEAINNSVGSPDKVKLRKDGDLSYFYKPQQEEAERKKKQQQMRPGRRITTAQKKPTRPVSGNKDKTIKQLLGSLYADREYLEKLLKEEDAKEKKTKTSQAIHNLALHGLLYLDTRTDFWRQQKPMYARKRDRELQQAKISKKGNTDPAKVTLMKLKEIDDYHTRGKYKDVIRESMKTINLVKTWTDEELGNKQEVTANLHSSAGNAYLELGDFENALHHHQQDLNLSQTLDNKDLESRAMDNIGRTYARVGKFDDAINIWEQKMQNKPDLQDTEAAWLCHELGRCYFANGQIDKSLDYGEQSYEHAQTADDEVWQLHSSVLIAQSQAKQGKLDSAVSSFERALTFANLQEDKEAESAILTAIDDLKDRIAKGENGTAEGENGEDGNTYEEEFQDADDEEELSPVGEEDEEDADYPSKHPTSPTLRPQLNTNTPLTTIRENFLYAKKLTSKRFSVCSLSSEDLVCNDINDSPAVSACNTPRKNKSKNAIKTSTNRLRLLKQDSSTKGKRVQLVLPALSSFRKDVNNANKQYKSCIPVRNWQPIKSNTPIDIRFYSQAKKENFQAASRHVSDQKQYSARSNSCKLPKLFMGANSAWKLPMKKQPTPKSFTAMYHTAITKAKFEHIKSRYMDIKRPVRKSNEQVNPGKEKSATLKSQKSRNKITLQSTAVHLKGKQPKKQSSYPKPICVPSAHDDESASTTSTLSSKVDERECKLSIEVKTPDENFPDTDSSMVCSTPVIETNEKSIDSGELQESNANEMKTNSNEDLLVTEQSKLTPVENNQNFCVDGTVVTSSAEIYSNVSMVEPSASVGESTDNVRLNTDNYSQIKQLETVNDPSSEILTPNEKTGCEKDSRQKLEDNNPKDSITFAEFLTQCGDMTNAQENNSENLLSNPKVKEKLDKTLCNATVNSEKEFTEVKTDIELAENLCNKLNVAQNASSKEKYVRLPTPVTSVSEKEIHSTTTKVVSERVNSKECSSTQQVLPSNAKQNLNSEVGGQIGAADQCISEGTDELVNNRPSSYLEPGAENNSDISKPETKTSDVVIDEAHIDS